MTSMEAVPQNMSEQGEIDLFDLADDIRDKWQWLAGTVVVCLTLALAYAFLATPGYQTEIVYKEVSEVGLLPLNQPALHEVFGGELLTPGRAFKEVRAKALSSATLQAFYNDLLAKNYPGLNDLILNPAITREQNFSQFAKRFTHKDPGAKDTDVFFSLQFELENAALASDVLNDFSQFVLAAYEDEKSRAVAMRIATQLALWRVDAEQKRTQYFAQKQRTLFDLKEAAKVAASINQERPLYSGERVAVGSTPPLYMMGEKVLRTQISELEGRSANGNEDDYIAGLAELKWKIDMVEKAAIDWRDVRFVTVDQAAIVPLKPVKPKKLLVVALGGIAGVMAGIMLALMAAALTRRKARKAAAHAH